MSLSPLSQADVGHHLHHFTNLEAHESQGPIMITEGRGIHVRDEQGRWYIEGVAGLWCAGLGFSEARLGAAAAAQFATLPYSHVFSHRSHGPAAELAQALTRIAPMPDARAFFVNSGSEAIDAAIKFVWYYHNARKQPKKRKFIARQRAYHGVTVAGAALTGLPYAKDGFNLPHDHVVHVGTPHYYGYAQAGESEEQFTDRLVAEIAQLIETEGADNIGAFVAEPVMGAGGVLLPPVGYFPKVQALLRQHDILFIADEVICGFARTGKMWGSQRFDITPDLVTCAKQLSAAYLPIGAVLLSGALYETLREQSAKLGVFGTGNTYGAHPVAAAVALETLRIYEQDGIVAHVQSLEAQFRARIEALGTHQHVGHARAVGLLGAIELVADKSSKTAFDPAQKTAPRLAAAMMEEGVIVRPTPGDSIGFCPPMIITSTELDEMFDRVQRALQRFFA